MTSREICNLALGYCSTNPLAGDLGVDTSTAGVLCSTFYEPTKAALLAERNWTFAKKTWTDTPATAPTHAVWTAAYDVPADCLRVHRVDDGEGDYSIEWELIGTQVLTDRDAATLYMEGIDGTVAESAFPAAFCFALAARLAVEICVPLTEGDTKFATLVKVAELKVEMASRVDGSQGKSERIAPGSLKQRR